MIEIESGGVELSGLGSSSKNKMLKNDDSNRVIRRTRLFYLLSVKGESARESRKRKKGSLLYNCWTQDIHWFKVIPAGEYWLIQRGGKEPILFESRDFLNGIISAMK